MICPGDAVLLHYALMFNDDEIFDSTFDDEPENIQIGSGELPVAIEQRLADLGAGETTEFTISATESAFGKYDEDNKQELSQDLFEDQIPDVGSLLEFELPGGGWLRGRIELVQDKSVRVDFNHPLIGRNVNCRVEILEIKHSGVLQ
ncbi:MAG: FKBP-type peptidyl-prolyl cis-trans isomerase 2 [Parasphingorhabdus sp.]|jgi:FKBP-type peptidyl-prolyl cis-trans isomerase 2